MIREFWKTGKIRESHVERKRTWVRAGFLILFLCLNTFLFAEENITTISIVSAQKTTYTKSENGNDCIVLEGSVEISVKKGDTTSEIKADVITYDRKTEMLYASGNVEITTKGSGSGGETTTADSLLLNTATLEGVFDGGRVVQTKSDALNLPSGSTLIVFSDLFGKTQNNTISFKNSRLTFCDESDPHWYIDSSRTWLLPGGEFAFLNALLYVGKTPVLWLPAFYYPKDELIFNPVFVTYKRKGYAIQNTYYLIGRKGLSSSSSSSSSDDDTTSSAESLKALYNFMKPTTLKEQERQGLIMHNLDANYSGKNSEYLKLMGDYYSNLGYFVGVDGSFQPNKFNITSLKFNVDLGFSQTIFPTNSSTYSSISTAGKTYWDWSNFMGLQIPFRYGADFEMSVSKPVKTTITMPLYSDPYFYYDFMTRSESMDWISYFLSHDSDDSSQGTYSSFTWKLASSYSPTLPAVLKPYISSLSLSLTSSLAFGTATSDFSQNTDEKRDDNGDRWTSYTPERSFYYPSQIIPATLTASMSGTLLQYPKTSTAEKKDEKTEFPVPLIMPEDLKTEKQKAEDKKKELAEKSAADENSEKQSESDVIPANAEMEENTEENAVAAADSGSDSQKEELLLAKMPELTTSVSTVTAPAGLVYKLGYSIAPNLTTQINYDASEVNDAGTSTVKYLYTPSDFKWSKIKSNMYTFKMPSSVTSNLSYGGSYFSMTNKLSYDPVIQDHPNKDGIVNDSKNSMKLADKKASTQTVAESNSIVYKPFAYVPMFADTSISWNTNLNIFKKDYSGAITDGELKGNDIYYKIWEYFMYEDGIDNEDSELYDADFVTKYKTLDAFKQKLITANTLNLTLSAKEADSKFKQNLSYSVAMPPQLWKHTLSLNTVFPYVNNTFSWSAQQKKTSTSTTSTTTTDSDESDDWTFNNLTQSLSASLFDKTLTISESASFVVDSDTNKTRDTATNASDKISNKNLACFFNFVDSFKLSASWKKMTASYVMSYTEGYDLDTDGGGWISKEVKQFQPYSLSFAWNPASSTYYRMANRISFTPSLSTSVTADLIRATNSYLSFSPALTFKINNFLDLSFSATSRNSTLYWYFQGDESIYNEAFGSNPFFMFFGDLVRSFGFAYGNANKGSFMKNRQASGFKLKSLNMTASHDAHDWSFKMIWKFEPKLVRNSKGVYEYNFDPYISIAIVWNPMDSMKTAIVHEYDSDTYDTVWELNP